MSQLLVTLISPGAASDEYAYALLSSAGVLTSHGRAAPALLPRADTATLIVPAHAVSWHLVTLPKLAKSMQGNSAQRTRALLAGVLEEQLLDDAFQLHLVACPSLSSDGKTWVAACDKALVQSAIEQLQAARVPLNRIVPEVFPSEAVSLHACGAQEAASLIYADAQGVLCVPLLQAALLPALPEALLISAEPAVAAQAELVLGERVNVLQAAQRAVQSATLALERGVDFAQGDLAVSGGGRAWQRLTGVLRDMLSAPQYKPARWGLALLLLANVIGLNAWSYQQHAAVQAKRVQMNQLLTNSFPNVKVVVDAPLQMQRELAALAQAQGQLSGRDFESIYGRFASIAVMNTAPSAIEYVANEVQLRGSGLSGAQLDPLLPKFQYAGLGVRSDAQALIISHRESTAPSVQGAAASTAQSTAAPSAQGKP